MNRRGFPFLALLLTLVVSRLAAQQPADLIAKAQSLAEQARADAQRADQSGDKAARSSARKRFEEAEKTIRQAMKRQPSCERCEEILALAYFGLGYIGEADGFEKCIAEGDRALKAFPLNGQIALYKGLAHYRRSEAAEAARAFKRYQASTARTAESDAIVAPALKASHDHFLSNWHNQANFYESGESRITRFNPQTFRNDVIFQVTRDYELQLGAQALTAVSQTMPTFNDPEAVAFIQQLVGRLTAKTPGPSFGYQVRLLDSPEVNAMTPPGHILVNTGLLRFVDNEAQLAGVLAHELAHNYGHHAARALIKAYHGQQLGNLIGQAVSGQGTVTQVITQLSTRVGLELFVRAYSRFEEKEADLYGTHLMFNGGYNPTAMSSFFLKMYERNARQPIKFLSTHPPAPDRVNYVTDYLETFPLDRELVVGSSQAFTELKKRYPSAEK